MGLSAVLGSSPLGGFTLAGSGLASITGLGVGLFTTALFDQHDHPVPLALVTATLPDGSPATVWLDSTARAPLSGPVPWNIPEPVGGQPQLTGITGAAQLYVFTVPGELLVTVTYAGVTRSFLGVADPITGGL